MKKNKGFTLAEMLIVVAIIGVIVAISVVILSSSFEKAREATDMANVRQAMSELTAAAADGYAPAITNPIEPNVVWQEDSTLKVVILTAQKEENWQTSDDAEIIDIGGRDAKYNEYGWIITCDASLENYNITLDVLPQDIYNKCNKEKK